MLAGHLGDGWLGLVSPDGMHLWEHRLGNDMDIAVR
jgi:hypothetical protein